MMGWHSLQRALTWRGQFNASSLLVTFLIQLFHFADSNRLGIRAFRKFYRGRRFKLRLRTNPTIIIVGRYVEYADFHAVEEVFLEKAYDVSSLSVIPDCILDAGGHIGTFTLLSGKTFPEVDLVTFEPDPDNFCLLSENVAANRIKARLLNCALGRISGTTYLEGPSSMGRRTGGSGIPVNQCRLSELIDWTKYHRVLLKIDVEGAEWDVLEDCRSSLPLSSILFIETHGGSEDLIQLQRWASVNGFSHNPTRIKGKFAESVLRRGEFDQNHHNS